VNDIGQNLQVIWPAPQQLAPPFPQHDNDFIEINDLLNPMNEDIAQVADNNNDANVVDEDDSSITLTISSGSGLPSAGQTFLLMAFRNNLMKSMLWRFSCSKLPLHCPFCLMA
jgi:hypothetical protein